MYLAKSWAVGSEVTAAPYLHPIILDSYCAIHHLFFSLLLDRTCKNVVCVCVCICLFNRSEQNQQNTPFCVPPFCTQQNRTLRILCYWTFLLTGFVYKLAIFASVHGCCQVINAVSKFKDRGWLQKSIVTSSMYFLHTPNRKKQDSLVRF